MIYRCTSPKYSSYIHYGGRGIYVCDRWRAFENFLHDMGDRPSKSHTLDRKDNDGPYSPENCRWATPQQQLRNTRRNHIIEFNGKKECLAYWSIAYGLSPNIIRRRLREFGWSVERALTTPRNTRAAINRPSINRQAPKSRWKPINLNTTPIGVDMK